jgi:ABC-type multidrug transport system fused ATPase/permease subunit
LINGLGPIFLLLTGVYLLDQGLFNVGGLVTIILAGTTLYVAVANMIWGFALLSQAVPPARRIEETLGNVSNK